METSELSQQADVISKYFKLMSNVSRLMVLSLLVDGAKNVGQLEKHVNLSQPGLSQHLAKLRSEGIVDTERRGQKIYYYITDERIKDILAATQTAV